MQSNGHKPVGSWRVWSFTAYEADGPATWYAYQNGAAPIYATSKGIPRVINLLCDRSLMIGASFGLRMIPADVVSEAAAALGLRSARAKASFWRDHIWLWTGLAAAAVIALVGALLLFAPLSNPF